MTELAALNVRITGESGDLSAALNSARGELQTFQGAVTKAQTSTRPLAGAMSRVGGAMSGARYQIQNVAFQLQDMAVQLQAGTSASVVFAQQGSQIASAFGPVGAVVGALAAVGIPLLAVAFANASAETKTFEDSLDGLKKITDELRAAQDILALSIPELYEQYGIYASQVREAAAALIELQNAEAQQSLRNLVIDNAEALDVFTGRLQGLFQSGEAAWEVLNRLQEQFGITRDQADRLRDAFRDLRFADDFQAQQEALARISVLMDETGISAEQLPPALRQALIQYNQMQIAAAELATETRNAEGAAIALASAGPKAGWLSAAISEAQTLATSLWDAYNASIAQAEANQKLQQMQMEFSPAGQAMDKYGGRGTVSNRPLTMGDGTEIRPEGQGGAVRGGVGGGAATENPLLAEIEALQEAYMTAEQIQMESYARQQETLQQALDQRLISQQEYANLMQQVEATHQHKMLQETNAGITGTLSALGQLFQGSKKIGAAVALANSWIAFTEVLKDPAYIGRPWARIAAAGAALASGLNAVRNIKSANPGSGAGAGGATGGGGAIASRGATGGAAAVTAPAQAPTQTLNFTISNDPFGFGERIVRQLASQLNEASRNGAAIRATVS